MTTKKILLYSGLAIAAVWGISKLMKKDKKDVEKEESSEFLGRLFFNKKKNNSPVSRTKPTDSSGNCPSGTIKYGNAKDGYYCKDLQGKDLSSMS
jgi:hypothetical protein